MKETTNYTLRLYELTFAKIDFGTIKSNWVKFFAALMVFPFMFVSVILALCVEEPVKIIMFLLFFQTTPKKAWEYYKKCWGSLLGGMRS